VNYQLIAVTLRKLLNVDTVQLSVDTTYFGTSDASTCVRTYVNISAFLGHQHFHEQAIVQGDKDCVRLGDVLDVLKSIHHKATKPRGNCPKCGVSNGWPSFDVLEAAVSEAA
jgi:hypothetical protein